MPFGLVWFGQAFAEKEFSVRTGVSNAFRLGLVWSAQRLSPYVLARIGCLQCLSAWSGLVRWVFSRTSGKPGKTSPMPFGLVWFGQAGASAEWTGNSDTSPMPFGLVWFGQAISLATATLAGDLVSNAFRLGLVWSDDIQAEYHAAANACLQCLSAWSGLVRWEE